MEVKKKMTTESLEGKAKPENPSEGIGPGFMMRVLNKIGYRPENLIVPGVTIKQGEELNGVFVCPQRLGEVYLSEEEARRELAENETLYRLDIRRIE